jgi:hypothetical protein
VFKSTDYLLLSFVKTLDMRNLVANRLNILWHIYLGPITPPAPQPEPMPVCPHCSGSLILEDDGGWFYAVCSACMWAGECFKTERDVFDAARKAGQS